MINKNILISFFAGLLMTGENSMASPVQVTLQFKNDNNQGGGAVVLTKNPLVDNFDWTNSNPEYKAAWILPEGEKSFKDMNQPVKILPGQSTSAFLSYRWNDKWYGLSQYSFNYADRPKEYGCYITELRLSGGRFESRNYNRVIATYRQDPNHLDDYLTCSVEKNTNSSFIIHMTSSKNKPDEKNMTNDSQRYSQMGDLEKIFIKPSEMTQPIELWRDDKENKALVLSLRSSNSVPNYIRPEQPFAYDFFYRIRLVNNTNQVIVAGEPLFNNWKKYKPSPDTLNSDALSSSFYPSDAYFFSQPQRIQANDTNSSPVILNSPPFSQNTGGVAVRINYHFEGYKENSGCYILAISPHPYYHFNQAETAIATYYRFDPTHPDKNLYCFISIDDATKATKAGFDTSFNGVTIVFYDNINAIKEVLLPDAKSLYLSYFNIYKSSIMNFNATYDTGDTMKTDSFYKKYISLFK